MILERTKDEDLITKVVAHPKVYPWVSEDGSPKAEDWKPEASNDRIFYVLVKEAGIILGLFAIIPENSVCYQIHTCLLPCSYGMLAKQAAKEIVDWVWRNIPECKRLVGQVPAFNRLALKYGFESFKMTQYGKNPKSFLKRGKLHDVILLGISRPGA
jgi:hypothetical protein